MDKRKQTKSKQLAADGVHCGKCGYLLAAANSPTNPGSSARAFIEAVEAHRCPAAIARRTHA